MLDTQTFKTVIENTLLASIDHFYSNSVVYENISTHYVNLAHYAYFKSKPEITLDDQHANFKWFDLSVVFNDQKC